jgi:hypothetical protein
LTGQRTTGRIRRIMRSVFRGMALGGSAVFTMAALVQGVVVGTVVAAHAAHDDHHRVLHDEHTAIELIVHGHEHESGTPEHEHSIVTAQSPPQHLRRYALPDSPLIASNAVLSSTPRIPLAPPSRTELCGLSPPSLNRKLVVLRI